MKNSKFEQFIKNEIRENGLSALSEPLFTSIVKKTVITRRSEKGGALYCWYDAEGGLIFECTAKVLEENGIPPETLQIGKTEINNLREEYVKNFFKSKTTQICVRLNVANDADIISCLDKQENKQGYIKRLIREDMRRRLPGADEAKGETK